MGEIVGRDCEAHTPKIPLGFFAPAAEGGICGGCGLCSGWLGEKGDR